MKVTVRPLSYETVHYLRISSSMFCGVEKENVLTYVPYFTMLLTHYMFCSSQSPRFNISSYVSSTLCNFLHSSVI